MSTSRTRRSANAKPRTAKPHDPWSTPDGKLAVQLARQGLEAIAQASGHYSGWDELKERLHRIHMQTNPLRALLCRGVPIAEDPEPAAPEGLDPRPVEQAMPTAHLPGPGREKLRTGTPCRGR